MSIYVAWDDETLGPYTPAEVAQLIDCGCLFPDDYAARNGDDTWVPLSSLLTVGAASPHVASGHLAPPTRRLWRPWLLATMLLLTLLAVLLSLLGLRKNGHDSKRVAAPQVFRPGFRVTVPDIRDIPDIATPSPPPAEERGGRINGTISLAASDASAGRLRTLTVRAYQVKVLEPYLAQKKAAAQGEIARLAPLIETAEAERDARVAAEQSAHKILLDTSPASELYPALQFAHQQAKGAVLTAENDVRYYRTQRHEVTGGEYYLYDLPTAVATAETNTQGEFSLDLPPGGPFAVVAADFQQTAEGTHARYWMVKVSFTDVGEKTLSLSDDNTTSIASAESLIQTED